MSIWGIFNLPGKKTRKERKQEKIQRKKSRRIAAANHEKKNKRLVVSRPGNGGNGTTGTAADLGRLSLAARATMIDESFGPGWDRVRTASVVRARHRC